MQILMAMQLKHSKYILKGTEVQLYIKCLIHIQFYSEDLSPKWVNPLKV